MKVLGLHFSSQEGNGPGNAARAIAQVRALCGQEPADLVVLPELFTSGYCDMDLRPWAETPDSPVFQAFCRLAREIDAVIGWGFVERADGHKVYNSYAVVEPGRAPQIVRKTHLHPSTSGTRSNEPEFLLAGDRLGLIETRLGKLGVMICYDGCFVEVPRSLVLMGAEAILWPSRSGGYLAGTGFPRMRAIDNIVPVIQIEGAQHGGALPMPAHSQIHDHQGVLLGERRGSEEGPLRAVIDTNAARQVRETSLNATAQYRVRRPELYTPIGGRMP